MKFFDFSPKRRCRHCRRVLSNNKITHGFDFFGYCDKSECFEAMNRLKAKLEKQFEANRLAKQKRKGKLMSKLTKQNLCIFEFIDPYEGIRHGYYFCAERALDGKFCRAHDVFCSYPYSKCINKALIAYKTCEHPLCKNHKSFYCHCDPPDLSD